MDKVIELICKKMSESDSGGLPEANYLYAFHVADSWNSFGMLYGWAMKQEWWSDFFWNHLHVMNESYGRQFDPTCIDFKEFKRRLYDYFTKPPRKVGL